MDRLKPYSILGLEPGSGPEEIKTAYRYLSKKYHPDRNKLHGSASRFVQVVKAYKVLHASSQKDRYIQSRLCHETEEKNAPDIFILGSKALSSRNAEERRRAARRLGLSGKKTAYVFLRRCLSDYDESVVCAAVRAIADLSVYQASGELAALWARSGSAVRTAILESAETTGEPLFKAAMELAAGEHKSLSPRAFRILAEIGKNGV